MYFFIEQCSLRVTWYNFDTATNSVIVRKMLNIIIRTAVATAGTGHDDSVTFQL